MPLDFFAGAGITVERILADNGTNYRSHLFCDHLRDHGIKELGPFLRYYNPDRPHGGIGGDTPISRVL